MDLVIHQLASKGKVNQS